MRDAAFTLDDLDFEEADVITFPFGPRLSEGETITAAEVEVAVLTGVDAGASAMQSGAPQIVGPDVLQAVLGRVVGVSYKLRCKATTSAGRVLVSSALIRVVAL